jgi:hypothetical protein
MLKYLPEEKQENNLLVLVGNVELLNILIVSNLNQNLTIVLSFITNQLTHGLKVFARATVKNINGLQQVFNGLQAKIVSLT